MTAVSAKNITTLRSEFDSLKRKLDATDVAFAQKKEAYLGFVSEVYSSALPLLQDPQVEVKAVALIQDTLGLQQRVNDLEFQNSLLGKTISFFKSPANLAKSALGLGLTYYYGWTGALATTCLAVAQVAAPKLIKKAKEQAPSSGPTHTLAELDAMLDLLLSGEHTQFDLPKMYHTFQSAVERNFFFFKDAPNFGVFKQKLEALHVKAFGKQQATKTFLPIEEMTLMADLLVKGELEADVGAAYKELHDCFVEYYVRYKDDPKFVDLLTNLSALQAKACPGVAAPADLAVPKVAMGLGNGGANCWANTLLQFLYRNKAIVDFLKAGTEFDHLDAVNVRGVNIYGLRTEGERREAKNLLKVMKAAVIQYEQDLKDPSKTISSVSSAAIRDALRGVISRITFGGHECAYEALRAFMSLLPSDSPLIKEMHTFRYYNLDGQPEPQDDSLTVRVESTGRRVAFSRGPVDPDTGRPVDSDWGNIRLFLPRDEDNLQIDNTTVSFRTIINGVERLMDYFRNTQGGEVGRYYTVPAATGSATRTRHDYPMIGETRVFNGPLPYLFVSGNRFGYDQLLGFSFKQNSPVYMPLDVIELPGAFFNQQDPVRYELISVMCHVGSTGGGHYYGYVKERGKWFECNDEFTKEVEDLQVMQKNMLSPGYVWQLRRVE